jgi:CRP/FNR family transcriptional regulator, cyclic AMP receptor protein
MMSLTDLLGWIAVIFTLAAFSMRTMKPLRMAAIGANLFFIAYAYLEGALPILALHAVLLPFNVVRLRQLTVVERPAERQAQGGLRDWDRFVLRRFLSTAWPK